MTIFEDVTYQYRGEVHSLAVFAPETIEVSPGIRALSQRVVALHDRTIVDAITLLGQYDPDVRRTYVRAGDLAYAVGKLRLRHGAHLPVSGWDGA